MPNDSSADRPIRVLVSSCLLGNCVRYDGRHKRDAFVVETLGALCELVPVCPEVESGLPVPREPMGLTGEPDAPRLTGVESGVDHTDRVAAWARVRLAELAPLRLSGYICKKGSPSCGLEGPGIFTRAFLASFPSAAVEDEERLSRAGPRRAFLDRALAPRRNGE